MLSLPIKIISVSPTTSNLALPRSFQKKKQFPVHEDRKRTSINRCYLLHFRVIYWPASKATVLPCVGSSLLPSLAFFLHPCVSFSFHHSPSSFPLPSLTHDGSVSWGSKTRERDSNRSSIHPKRFISPDESCALCWPHHIICGSRQSAEGNVVWGRNRPASVKKQQ